MIVLILSAAPVSLRGAMTRWLLEVSPGVFVGHLSTRVREQVWEMVQAHIGNGRALLIWSVRSEQRFAIASLGHEREPVDCEGCTVMRSMYTQKEGWESLPGAVKPVKESWSIAGRRRRFRNSTERALGSQ